MAKRRSRRSSVTTPDIILVDIQLPDVDGLEITRRLRQEERFAKTPIVALTAYAMPGDREMFLRAGCTGYVAKPIDTRAFPDIIASYLPRPDGMSPIEGASPE